MSEQKQKTRAEIAEADKWAVSKIYSDPAEWKKDLKTLKELSGKIPAFSGKLGGAAELLAYLTLTERVNRLAEKLCVYASMRADEDTANPDFMAMDHAASGFIAELMAKEAFFEPEILALPEGSVEAELKQEPALEVYRFALQDILRRKPHTLDAKSEAILAAVSDNLEAVQRSYSLLTNADMTFPEIHGEDGKLTELTESNYMVHLTSRNRAVREEAFKTLFRTYGNFRNTFASLLTSSVKNSVFMAKQHGYSSALACLLAPNNIPESVYREALATTGAHLDVLHRYVSLKKKLLKLDEIHMYDLYVPLINVPEKHYTFDEAVTMIRAGLAPLGREYVGLFERGIAAGWVDRYPNKGKRSGGYSTGSYDTQPYILMNFNGNYDGVSTLAHEMGHSIHSYYSTHHQPYVYSRYSLFLAETASTTNESLLIHYLIDRESDSAQKLSLINSQLEQIRTTVFRQLLFAEFELFTHEKAEHGEELTAKDLCAFWHEVNRKYYGPEIMIDDEIDMEWARIPHFYSDYYVYQYATGYAAANSFSRMIREGKPDAVKKYTDFLKSGSSAYPIDVLRRAGVNMETPAPMEDLVKTFSELLDLLEGAL